MRKLVIQLMVIFQLLVCSVSFSQSAKKTADVIPYGNNSKVGKYLLTRGIKLYYETYGQGQPLLLIHGNGGSIKDFKYQIPYFEKYYKVIAVDSRAQGKSVDFGNELHYEQMADDFNALLDSLHISKAYVIGWSDGGINGLLLAIRHPDKVKKLATTGANLIPDSTVLTPSASAFIRDNIAQLKAGKQNDDIRNGIKLLHMMEVEPHITHADLRTIQCPVLVIGGDHDVIKPVHTLEIFENIPQAYLWILPASGHGTVQRFKEEFNTKVQHFFTTTYKKVEWLDWDIN